MCGIVGVAGEVNFKTRKLFRRLLELDTVRGPHSTGVFTVNLQNELKFDKIVGTPWDFFSESKVFDNNFNNGVYKVMVGHNRWATHGKITEENAHPFDFDKLIGVHNGTIDGKAFQWLRENGKGHVVDSYMLYSAFDKTGMKETINNIDGAWSCVWWDKEEKSINFIRNSKRPMHYAYTKDEKTLIFASEPWMIIAAAYTSEVELSGSPQETHENYHYELSLEKDSPIKDPLNFIYYEEEIKGKVFPVEYYKGSAWEDGRDWGSFGSFKSYYKSTTPTPPQSNYLAKKEKVFSEITDRNGNCPVYWHKMHSKTVYWPSYAKIILKSFLGNVNVQLSGSPEQVKEIFNKIENSEGWFFVTPKGYIVPTNNGEEPEYIIADVNTLSEEYPWDDIINIDVIPEGKEELEEVESSKQDMVFVTKDLCVSFDNWKRAIEKEGCSFCQTQEVDVKDAKKMFWINYSAGAFLCPTCAGNDGNNLLPFYHV